MTSADERSRNVLSPADGEVVGSVELASPDDVDQYVARARTAFADWHRVAPHARAAVLHAAASTLADRVDELGLMHARESGKVIAQARNEIRGAAALLEANAELARFDSGYLAPTGALAGTDRDLTLVERVPLGVIVCVVPFNFPVELTVEKAAAALAAGNAVILKPPPQNPLATIETARVIQAAGLPPGVLQILPGDTALSAALCAAPGVDAISLTGSVGAGVAVARATAHLLRPLHLELGGNGSVIILKDADLEWVASEVLRGRLLMNGQACAATKRIITVGNTGDSLVDLLAESLRKITTGDPTAASSDVGPLIDAPSAKRVAGQVGRVITEGGSLVLGGAEAKDAWFEPTLLSGVPSTAAVAADDEIFGPVFPLIPVETIDEAVAVSNQSQLGLTAAVFAADVPRALAVAQRLDVGGVVINGTNNYRPPVVPFGGVGLAGTGREGIGYTYEEMTRTKFIAMRHMRPEHAELVLPDE